MVIVKTSKQFYYLNTEWLRWVGHVKRMPGNRLLLKVFRMGTRGNTKKGKTQREMDRWSKTEHDKLWTERRGY
jgi:hypothetical protein